MQKIFLALMLLIGVSTVSAQTGGANLGRCLADSTTGKDRKDLVKWIVVAMIQHPAMAELSTVSPTQIEQVNKTTAQLVVRLLTVDCKVELKSAYKSGGEEAIGSAFESLGIVAVQEVMTDSKVKKAIEDTFKYFDFKKIGGAISNQSAQVSPFRLNRRTRRKS